MLFYRQSTILNTFATIYQILAYLLFLLLVLFFIFRIAFRRKVAVPSHLFFSNISSIPLIPRPKVFKNIHLITSTLIYLYN